jgi:hypothetical protein
MSSLGGDVPAPRSHHGMVAIHNQLWLLGGLAPNGSVYSSDLYVLDTSSEPLLWSKKTVSSAMVPEGRTNFGIAVSGTTIFVSKMFNCIFCVCM